MFDVGNDTAFGADHCTPAIKEKLTLDKLNSYGKLLRSSRIKEKSSCLIEQESIFIPGMDFLQTIFGGKESCSRQELGNLPA